MPFNATSSPGPSPRSKWWSEKPLAKAAENGVFCHVTHDEMAFCRRLFPASGGPVCFLQSETLIQTKLERGKGPGDDVAFNVVHHPSKSFNIIQEGEQTRLT